jgi:hypothetical protein
MSWEILESPPELSLHRTKDARRDVDGHPGAFIKINLQAGGEGEHVQQPLLSPGRGDISTHDDQRVICVLEDGARGTIDEGVAQERILLDQLLEHITHNQKEVGRQRITLAQPTPAINPPPMNTVEEDRCL